MPIRSRKELGAAIARARKALALSQGDLGRKASLRQPLISELENGTTNATLDTVLKVLAALDLDLAVESRRKGGFDPAEY